MLSVTACVTLTLVALGATRAQDLDVFPPGFMFATATSSYQIEGAWNESGKGQTIWDSFTHDHPEKITDGSNGDMACDSYNNYKRDVQMIKEMGLSMYRFSIAWARILPSGEIQDVNQEGLDYYNNLIDELLANDIQPLVTMYHWDLPQHLQDIGGWTNPLIVNQYVDYADLLFATYGDRVKWWITFNEPGETSKGYAEGATAPGLFLHGEGEYLVAHTILKAHASAYHLYNDTYKLTQQGQVGITLNSDWSGPLTNSSEDIQASVHAMQFYLGWFAHPIYSAEGDYPAVMKTRIAANSLAEGRPRSRLPEFSAEWVAYIRGTSDFFGLNHYTTNYASAQLWGPDPSRWRDAGCGFSQDPAWPGSATSWLKVVPWGFRKLLEWISLEYSNPPIFVTENGVSTQDELDDESRTYYYVNYLRELLKAHYLDGVNVVGYTAWSLMDNFEWQKGYTERYGLYHVDFNDPARTRTAKDSAQVFGDIVRSGRLPPAQ